MMYRLMLGKRLTSPGLLVGVALWAASLALYLFTSAPTLTWGHDKIGVDGGELLAAAKTLGVPHPPGNPTYTLLLKLWATLVPVGDFAHRGNLLSAVLASLSVALLYAIVLRFCRHLRPDGPAVFGVASGALGATVFATSPLFWSQAVMTEVYTLNTLFVGALLLIAADLALRRPANGDGQARSTAPRLALFGFLLGLGLGNHTTLLAVGLPLLCWIAVTLGWRKLASPWAVGAFILGLGIYVYLPIRASHSPPINWGDADTLSGMVWMLTARAYQDYAFGVSLGSIPERFISWAELVFSQFNPLGIFLGLVAIGPLIARMRVFLFASLISIALLSIYSITYNTFDSEVLMIPAFMLFSTWVGVGFDRVLSTASGWTLALKSSGKAAGVRLASLRPPLLLSAIAFGALPLASLILNLGDQNLRNEDQAYRYAQEIFDSVPDGSLVLSLEEDAAFAMWYMSYVEKTGRDVAPIAVPLLRFDWYVRDILARYPDRFPPQLPAQYTEAVTSIVEHNLGRTELYFTYWDQLLANLLDYEQVGSLNLLKAMPLTAQQ